MKKWLIVLALLILPIMAHSSEGRYSIFTEEGYRNKILLLDTETGEVYEKMTSVENPWTPKWVKIMDAVPKPGFFDQIFNFGSLKSKK